MSEIPVQPPDGLGYGENVVVGYEGGLPATPNNEFTPKPRTRGKRKPGSARVRTRFDQEMIDAMRSKTPVSVSLAVDSPFTDADGSFDALVEWVDVYAVKFVTADFPSFWVSKKFIVSVCIKDGKN
jgi:hypothetical protein